MTIEIKVTGADATETVQQFLGLAGYLGTTRALVVAATDDDDEPVVGSVPTAGVDKDGIPFDARIHSSAANPFKADGTWKRRKNVSDDEYNRIYAELKVRGVPQSELKESAAVSGAPAAVDTPAPAPQAAQTVIVADVANVAPPPAPETAAATVPPPPAPETTAAVAPPPAAYTGKTHADLKGILTKTLGAINTALPGKAAILLKEMMAGYGVVSFDQVPADKIDECYDRMSRMAADPANAESIAAGLM